MRFPETNKPFLVVSVFKQAHGPEETRVVDEFNVRYFEKILFGPNCSTSCLHDRGNLLDVGGKHVSSLPVAGLDSDRPKSLDHPLRAVKSPFRISFSSR